MIILGKTSDDKGKQLETLTHDLLIRIGCKNIQVNQISSGGEEIDVVADIPIPGIVDSANTTKRIICECKAHSKPIDSSPWLKFLGKVFFEESRLNCEIIAYFIALSGVNGNVSGNYDELKNHRSNIILIKGDALLDKLKEIYDLCSVQDVIQTIEKYTKQQYIKLEIAYYERDVYWIVFFDDEKYTILDSSARIIKKTKLEVLKVLIRENLSATIYVDLEDYDEARKRANHIKKLVIAEIFKNYGNVYKKFNLSVNNLRVSEDEINEAVSFLIVNKYIVSNKDKTVLSFPKDNSKKFYENLARIYLFLLNGTLFSDLKEVLDCKYYNQYINKFLVAEIQKIQAALPLSGEDVVKAINFLKWSPSALVWALFPDPMITAHRLEQNDEIPAYFDDFDRNYFFSQLYKNLLNDLRIQITLERLFLNFGVNEVHTRQKISVKSNNGIETENELDEKLGIGWLTGEENKINGRYPIILTAILKT